MAGINLKKQLSAQAKGGTAPIGAGDGGPKFSVFTDNEFTKEDKLRLVLILVGIGIVFGSSYVVDDYTAGEFAKKQAESAAVSEKINQKQGELAKLKDLDNEANTYDKRVQELQAKFNLVESVSKNRNVLVRVADFVVSEMPESVWLTKMNVDMAESKIEVLGNAVSLQVVSEFVKRLEGAVFFPQWKLVETENETTTPGGPGSSPIESKKFTLNAKVIRP